MKPKQRKNSCFAEVLEKNIFEKIAKVLGTKVVFAKFVKRV
jgi:hypothetical protein